MPTYHVHSSKGSFGSGFGCTLGVIAAVLFVFVALPILFFCVLPAGAVIVLPAAQKIREAEERVRAEQEAAQRERATAPTSATAPAIPPPPPIPVAGDVADTTSDTGLAVTAAAHAKGDYLVTLATATELKILDAPAPAGLLAVRVSAGPHEGRIGFVAAKNVAKR